MRDIISNQKCSVKVAPPGQWGPFHRYQCTKKAVVERDDKWYCKIHAPEYIKQKEAKREAKRKAKGCQKCGWDMKRYWDYCPHCGTKRDINKGV